MRVQKRVILTFFMIVTALLGISGCGQSQKSDTAGENDVYVSDEVNETNDTDAELDSTEEDTDHADETQYVLTKIDENNSVLVFSEVDTGKEVQYAYNGATYFLDKYGQSKTIASFECGKVVTLKTSSTDGKLDTVQMSDTVWDYSDVTDFSIDEESQVITLAGTKYYYGSNFWSFSYNEEINLSDITNSDTIYVQGTDRKIISVIVTTGHGTVSFTNTSTFEGGWLQIGSKIFKQVTADMVVEVPEGTYDLSVANDGYGDTKEITVERGQNLEVDLDQLKGEGPKYCTITFAVAVEGAVLTINGAVTDYSQPVSLRYGTYVLGLSADGYESISNRLVVSSETAEISLTLSSDGSSSSTSTEESTDSSSTDSTSTDSTSTDSTSTDTTTSSGTTSSTSGLAGSLAGSLAGTNSGSSSSSSSSTGTTSSTSGTSSDTSSSTSTGSTSSDSNSSSSSSDTSTSDTVSALLNILGSSND